jgi:hypothetical protein
VDNSKWSKWCERLVFLFLGYIITQISPPLFTDIYNVTLKKWFFERKAMITLYAVSTTTLSPLSNYKENNNYYEITSFKIINAGKELDKEAKLKIEARGEIIGITPDTLKNRLEVQKDDPSHAFLKIVGLAPEEQIKGEIHSFAKMANDRNKSAIGFDSAGNFKLTIKVD